MISAIILAAGRSRRMGQPKMLLPWGKLTVIEQVVTTFLNAGIEDLVVVSGAAHELVMQAIEGLPARVTHNSEYAAGEMLSSLQCGIRAMPERTRATFIGLGDQPQVQERTIRLICDAYREGNSGLTVPSFQMKRGHPWLASRPLWDELLALEPPETLRDFLTRNSGQIEYVNVDTPTVLADLDTPEDYQASHP
jgi:molybdenum cofactor cytidylyltransferase